MQPERCTTDPRPERLVCWVRKAIQRRHHSPSTGGTYTHWIQRYILCHAKRRPNEMGAPELETSLTRLSVQKLHTASLHADSATALQVGCHKSRPEQQHGRAPERRRFDAFVRY